MATMSFKIGDKVRLVGDPFSCVGKDKLFGTIAVIKNCRGGAYPYVLETTDGEELIWAWRDSEFEPVTESKYKVGDKVRVRSDLQKFGKYGGMNVLLEMYEYRGKTVVIDRVEQNGKYYGIKGYCHTFWTNDMFEGLAVEQNKIVITHDGKTTTATLYREDGSKEVATAKCCPEDTFDFNVGAKLAMERLMKKVAPVEEWRVVDREPRVGDYIRLTTDGNYSFSEPGDILKVDALGYGTVVRVYGRNHPRYTRDPNHLWGYKGDEYEVVEKVTTTEPKKPEPPKYFTGKVVCIRSGYNHWTVGKIYDVKDGIIVSNTGMVHPRFNATPYRDAEDIRHAGSLCGVDIRHNTLNEFIPIVE